MKKIKPNVKFLPHFLRLILHMINTLINLQQNKDKECILMFGYRQFYDTLSFVDEL